MVVLACFSPPSGIKGNVMEIENNGLDGLNGLFHWQFALVLPSVQSV